MKFSIKEAPQNVIGEFAMCMLNGVTAGHIHHLTTNSYAEHIALGDFYDGLDDLSDKFIEAYQGKYDLIDFPEKPMYRGNTGTDLVMYVSKQIADYRRMPGFPQDSDLQNIVDELSDLTASTLYKLRFLK